MRCRFGQGRNTCQIKNMIYLALLYWFQSFSLSSLLLWHVIAVPCKIYIVRFWVWYFVLPWIFFLLERKSIDWVPKRKNCCTLTYLIIGPAIIIINRPSIRCLLTSFICFERFAITSLKNCRIKFLGIEVVFSKATNIEFYHLIPLVICLGRDILAYAQFLCSSYITLHTITYCYFFYWCLKRHNALCVLWSIRLRGQQMLYYSDELVNGVQRMPLGSATLYLLC